MSVLGLNTAFESLKYDGLKEESFSSEISLLDYETVVIDVDFLIENTYGIGSETYRNKMLLSEYSSHKIVEDYAKIKEQIIELLKQGRNIVILMGKNESCYIYTGERQYSGTGKNARETTLLREFDTYSFLPITIKATHVYGNEVKICCESPYRDFLRQTSEISQYESYFTVKERSSVLATIKGTNKTVSSVCPYKNGNIVCLPHPFYEDNYSTSDYWEEYGKRYLDSLFELIAQLGHADDARFLPAWADNLYILSEREELTRQVIIEEEIERQQRALAEQKQRIEELQKYKLLLTSSGSTLEEITKTVLNELGFRLLNAEKGRSDIIARYGDISIVAEIKGVTKSAAEKHAAQLEKWVSQYIEDNDNIPRALLIVNGYCDTPLADRTEAVFPHQMLKYCEARGHILISTIQLLCLYIDTQNNPESVEDRIEELLSCVGKYERYKDISPYIDLDVE